MGASSSDPSHNIELRGSGWAVGRYVKGGSAGAKLQVPGMQSGAAGLCIFQLRNCASPPKPPPHWGRVRWGTWLVRSQFERPTKVADTTTSRGPWQGHRGLPVAKKQLKHTAYRTEYMSPNSFSMSPRRNLRTVCSSSNQRSRKGVSWINQKFTWY